MNTSSLFTSLRLVAAALLLAGCGAFNTSQNNADSDLITPAPLEVANTGVTSTPANNATNVSPSDPLLVRFATVTNRPQIENTFTLIPGAISNNVAGLQKLTLTSMCNGRWRVRNPNASATLVFTWDVYGKTERGSGIVPGGRDVFFNTSVGSNTVRVFVNGQLNNTKATNPANCTGSTPKVPGAITGSVGWNNAGTEFTFTPSAPLEENKPYTLFVGLNTPYAATFTTGSAVTVPQNGEFAAVVANGFGSISFSRVGGNTPLELSGTSTAWDAGSKVFSFSFSAKNLGSEAFSNLRFILSSFLPDTVTAVSPSGYTAENKPFFDLGAVAAGETKTVTWRFSSPSDSAFRFNLTPLRTQTEITLTQASPAQFRNDVVQTLTLKGTGFRAETAFFVESTKLDVLSWTATQTTVRLPAGFMPATYGMMAVNPDGNKATLYPAFTVQAGAPAPLVDQRLNPFSFVDGLVIDYETKKPIANADVSFPGFRAKTDDSGWFFMRGVPRGRHNILIEAEGYEPVYRIAEVTGSQQTVTLKLSELEKKDPKVSYIGPSGGTHRASNGSFLVIPEGALDQTVPIRFTHTRAANTLPQLPQDGYYLAFARLEPVGLHFKKPATLFLPLQEGIVLPEGQPIRISYYEPHQQKWVQDITAGVIKKIDNQLYLEYEINHFTWIGGQWVSDSVGGCVKHSDGSPASGIVTNYGVTDLNGNFSGSTTRTGEPRTLTATAYDYDGNPKSVSGTYSGNGAFRFGNSGSNSVRTNSGDGCINIGERPVTPKADIDLGSESGTGDQCNNPIRKNTLTLGRQNSSGKALLLSRGGLTEVKGSIPNASAQRMDLSTFKFSINGVDYTKQTILKQEGNDVDFTFSLTEPLRSGLDQNFKVEVSNQLGSLGGATQKADVVAGFKSSNMSIVVLPDEAFQTPGLPTVINNEYGKTHVFSESQVQSGSVNVVYEIATIDETGNIFAVQSDAAFAVAGVAGEGFAQQPAKLGDGFAQIQLTVPVKSEGIGIPIKLGKLRIQSNSAGASSNSTRKQNTNCEDEIETSTSNGQEPEMQTQTKEEGRNFWEWIRDLGPDGVKFFIGLSPVGDGWEILKQAYYCSTKNSQCDGVTAFFAAIGLGGDVVPGAQGIGVGASALKNIRAISKTGSGFIGDYMNEVVFDTIVKYAKQGLSPKEAAEKAWAEVSAKLGGVVDIFLEGGTELVKKSDDLAANLRKINCIGGSSLVRQNGPACSVEDVINAVTGVIDNTKRFQAQYREATGEYISAREVIEQLTRYTGNAGEETVSGVKKQIIDKLNSARDFSNAIGVLNELRWAKVIESSGQTLKAFPSAAKQGEADLDILSEGRIGSQTVLFGDQVKTSSSSLGRVDRSANGSIVGIAQIDELIQWSNQGGKVGRVIFMDASDLPSDVVSWMRSKGLKVLDGKGNEVR